MNLRPYQEEASEQLRDGYRRGLRRQVLVSPTGSGKTVIFAFTTKRAVERGLRVMILAHRQEIIAQIQRALRAVDVPHGTITSGQPYDRSFPVHVASVQTLVRRFDKVVPPDFVILDECFVMGTMVSNRPIESINVGDKITAWDGEPDTVTDIYRSRPNSLITVRAGNRSVVCTPNHPFLTPDGWKRGIDLSFGDMVLTTIPHDVCHLLKPLPKQALWETGMSGGVFSPDHQEHVQEAWRGDYSLSEDQWNVRSQSSREGINFPEGYGVAAHCSGWEREAFDCSSASSGVQVGMENRSSNHNCYASEFGISYLLQIRRCQSRTEGRYRRGRFKSSFSGSQTQRLKKGHVLSWVRVEGVTVHQPTSDGTFGGVCPDGFVYNLTTRRTHTYIANGIVVHNCHHVAARQWASVFAEYSKARFLGVTATPERLDGRGLGEFFDGMVLGPTVQWLIDNGFLARPVYYAPPPDRQVDASRLKKTAGDYARGAAAELVDQPSITGDAIEHYKRLCPGKRAIVFCVSLEHAQRVCERFLAAGIGASVIDGTLSDSDRRKRIADLESGLIPVLISVDLVSEGFDLPSVEAAFLLRPTASLALARQQMGRALRPKPGANSCLILDHVGNLRRHGLAESPVEWTLEGGAAKRRKTTASFEARQCKSCFAMFSGRSCPQCGEETDTEGRTIIERKGELVLMTASEFANERQRLAHKMEEWKCRTLQDWQDLAKKRGHAPGWAFFRWKSSRWASRVNPDDARPSVKQPSLIPL